MSNVFNSFTPEEQDETRDELIARIKKASKDDFKGYWGIISKTASDPDEIGEERARKKKWISNKAKKLLEKERAEKAERIKAQKPIKEVAIKQRALDMKISLEKKNLNGIAEESKSSEGVEEVYKLKAPKNNDADPWLDQAAVTFF